MTTAQFRNENDICAICFLPQTSSNQTEWFAPRNSRFLIRKSFLRGEIQNRESNAEADEGEAIAQKGLDFA